MNSEVAARVTAFLDALHVMSLATLGPDGAQAANLFYARDGFSLVWLSDPLSRHSLALEADGRVSATIAPDYSDFGEIRGLQIAGDACLIAGEAAQRRAMELLQTRYAFLKRLAAAAPLAEAVARAAPYRLVPRTIVMIDNTRGFGHKDTLEFVSSR